MTSPGNEPGAVVERHALDRASLSAYLRTLGYDGPLDVKEFGGGYSNVTYLLQIGERELVMRRGPVGVTVHGAHDMGREHRTLTALAPMWTKSPRPVALCEDLAVIGAKFYLMERVDGVVLRRDVVLPPETMRRLSENLIDTLVEFHQIDYEKAGLGHIGKPVGFLDRQVKGWVERYRVARTDEVPDVEIIEAWLAANIPTPQPPTLLHNDYKYDNVLMDRALTGVKCVLDWEMTTLGDPLVDLGASLALWMQEGDAPDLMAARFGPTHLPGNLTRLEVAQRYAQRTGADLSALPWYYVLGLYKMIGALAQLYRRYVLGHTREERYRTLAVAVRGMAAEGRRVLERGEIRS
jgi:aminoglycoside phosphotransferase (APT) family kinase protein